jgi:hypothetical protein
MVEHWQGREKASLHSSQAQVVEVLQQQDKMAVQVPKVEMVEQVLMLPVS